MTVQLGNIARKVFGVLSKAILIALFLPLVAALAQGSAQQSAVDLRLSGDASMTRLEIDYDRSPEITPSLLANPYRLVLDMPETHFALGETAPQLVGIVSSYRYGLIQAGRSRVVIAIEKPFSASEPLITPSADGKRFTLKIDLKPVKEAVFRAAVDNQQVTTSSVAGGKGDRVGEAVEGAPFTIVVDPGHGGIDGGATGANGGVEKAITLAFAKELKARLGELPRLRVFLTREDDRFIALDERVKIARQLNASLFISIHADTIRDKTMRGATVYTLSEKASDEVAHAVAQQENLSDAIGGVAADVGDQDVADILIDLTRRETMQFSVQFARSLVESLKKKTKTINHPHRSAGFKVLKAPDIPSVLVELGYLSNAEDEKMVSDPEWRSGVLNEMVKAISDYADAQIVARQ